MGGQDKTKAGQEVLFELMKDTHSKVFLGHITLTQPCNTKMYMRKYCKDKTACIHALIDAHRAQLPLSSQHGGDQSEVFALQ